MTDLPENIVEYSKRHRRRERRENGTVELVGKHEKKWKGIYHIYKTGTDGKEIREKRRRILGTKAEIPTKFQAEEVLRNWIRRNVGQAVAETPADAVAALCDDYVELRQGDWQEHTLATNLTILALIKESFGSWPIERVQPEDLKRFLNSLPKRKWRSGNQIKTGCSVSQAEKCITYLRAIFDLAVERAAQRGVLFLNPARSKTTELSVPKACREPDKTVFPPAELVPLVGQLGERDRLIVWLAVVSPRPSEIFALMGRNVGPGFIHIESSLSKHRKVGKTKTGNQKKIALSPELDRGIHRWIREHEIGPNDFLFTTRVGTPMILKNFLRRNLRGAAKKAGICTLDVDFQMLRRSFATLANVIGGDPKSIQTQMGHARPDMWLLEYAQPVDDAQRQLVERIENILLGKEPLPVDFAAKLGSRFVQ